MTPIYNLNDGLNIDWGVNSDFWKIPYTNFIIKYTKIKKHFIFGTIKIRFLREISRHYPGDSDGITPNPYSIELSITTRWSLIRLNSHKKNKIFIKEGLFVLFRQVAYAEFWQEDLFFWFFKWLWDKKKWKKKAEERALGLIKIWFLVGD